MGFERKNQQESPGGNIETGAVFADGLRKSFRGKQVLKDVRFFVPKGTVYTLLGSNGAGKTTTVRILTGQIRADGGTVMTAGYDVAEQPKKVYKEISLTGQFSALDEGLTGRENLIFMGKLRQEAEPEKRAAELLSQFGLSASADQAAGTYSGGMKRKLDIAMSLLGNPKILFLDEPTTGLDPLSRRDMWEMIKKLRHQGVTVFLTTQYLDEAEELSDKIGILDGGEIIAEGTPKELKAYLPQGGLQFSFQDSEELNKARELLKGYQTDKTEEKQILTVFTDGSTVFAAELFRRFYEAGIVPLDFGKHTPTLEDVFLAIVKERKEKTDGDRKKKL